jgi:putative acetyltransferase
MLLNDILIREIKQGDNAVMANIIRTALTEFNANKPGTVFYDPTTDALYELFQSASRSFYYVATHNNELVGGAGIYPTVNLPANTCELVKMYLKKEARHIGLGRKMINQCLVKAKELGYKQVYLETMPELKNAIKAYEKFGFSYLKGPLGNSGHHGCDMWMLKQL